MNTLETKRLFLRDWKETDVEPFFHINQDPKVLEFLPAPWTLEETRNWIKHTKQNLHQHTFGLWATELKATGTFIGYVGLRVPDFKAPFTPCVDIEWRLSSEHWGFGYATEAALAVLELGFTHYGFKEIVSFTVPANYRSIRVMKKIGMTRDATGDFHHPKLPLEHPLSLHVLYRKPNPSRTL